MHKKKVIWSKLDNASKIFPATCNKTDTKVFRISCELKENVSPEILQLALDKTLESFPHFKATLRRGVFWYYFERTDLTPQVHEENLPICSAIYNKTQKTLLFRVFYYKRRISLEVFHALTDGTGAFWFMEILIYHYLVNKYKKAFLDKLPPLRHIGSISEKTDDSFGRYFEGKTKKIIKKHPKAYSIRGTRLEENRMKLIEGTMSAKAILDIAHKYNTTLTAYLTSLFIYSIIEDMPNYNKKPVILSVPINLRKFFPSTTARNFFSTMNIAYYPQKNNNLEKIIGEVDKSFKEELTEEKINEHLNRLMAFEKNLLARIVPLPVKDMILKIANKIIDTTITGSISNMGIIKLPKEFSNYIEKFSVYTSARRPQICMCSYNDKLVVSFTSPYEETQIQHVFFEQLANNGVDIEIATN